MSFIEVHDTTEDSLCERTRPEFDFFKGYLIEDAIREAANRWRGHAKEIRVFHGEKPPKGTKHHDMKPYNILQIGEC